MFRFLGAVIVASLAFSGGLIGGDGCALGQGQCCCTMANGATCCGYAAECGRAIAGCPCR